MAPSTPQDEVQSDQSLIGAMQPRKKARSWKGVVTSPLRLGPSCWPGITNLGNTCYASALAQALSACPPFMKQASLVAPDKLKSSPPTWLALYDVARNAQISFEQRMEELVEAHKNPESFKPEDDESEEPHRLLGICNGAALDPFEYISSLASSGYELEFGRQQDAHEALRAVCSDRTVVSDSDNGETIDIRSPMEVFEGSFKTIIKCRTCNNTAERVETFQDLTINAAKQTSLVHGLHRLTRIEKLEDEDAYFCQHCQSFQPGMRQTLINKLPDVLVFHISRFSMTGEKILATIPAPLHMSMTPWTVDNFGLTPDISKPPTDCYSLVSAVLHFGQSPFSGHYTANTKLSNKQSSQWSRFVADLDPKEALTKDFIDSPWLSCDDERVSNFIWPPLWTDASQTPSVPSPNLLFYCKTS